MIPTQPTAHSAWKRYIAMCPLFYILLITNTDKELGYLIERR